MNTCNYYEQNFDFASATATIISCSNNNNTTAGGDQRTKTLLPEGFWPGDHDVIIGRGRDVYWHPGNERFRDLVASRLMEYACTTKRNGKSFIIQEIVARVRLESLNGGGFVKKCREDKRWYEVGDIVARERTSQAFRDFLHERYSSSKESKKKGRCKGDLKALKSVKNHPVFETVSEDDELSDKVSESQSAASSTTTTTTTTTEQKSSNAGSSSSPVEVDVTTTTKTSKPIEDLLSEPIYDDLYLDNVNSPTVTTNYFLDILLFTESKNNDDSEESKVVDLQQQNRTPPPSPPLGNSSADNSEPLSPLEYNATAPVFQGLGFSPAHVKKIVATQRFFNFNMELLEPHPITLSSSQTFHNECSLPKLDTDEKHMLRKLVFDSSDHSSKQSHIDDDRNESYANPFSLLF